MDILLHHLLYYNGRNLSFNTIISYLHSHFKFYVDVINQVYVRITKLQAIAVKDDGVMRI